MLIYVTQPRRHFRDRPHMIPLSRQSPRPLGLSLRNYHLRESTGSKISQAIWATRNGGFNLMILTETNITNHIYYRNRMGYNVVWLETIISADSDIQGGVRMIIKDQTQGWGIGWTHFHRTNVRSCKIITRKNTPFIGAYPPPPLFTLERLPDLVEALTHFKDQEPILLWNLNTNIQAQNHCRRQVFEVLMEFGLEDLQHHLVSAGGSDTSYVVSDAAWYIVVKINMNKYMGNIRAASIWWE